MSLVDKYFENYSKFTSKKKKQSKYIIRAILLSIEKEIHENSLSLTIFQILFNYFIYMAEKIKAKKY